MPRATLADIRGGDAAENVAITQAILAGEAGPKRDIAVVNAAPAIVAAGMAEGFIEGVDLAQQAVDSGDAQGVLERVVAMSEEYDG